ncbi:peptidyl-prolyl cis-trans isomerase-like 6 [Anoplophora glabripennis]|uniref:peptidyl-prolyl cis-trans isomerase-like 6 n=1 Tax=Anoplophora glabripennis TaxID=217634 RepID=UPI0008757A9F|nr:peptidyl-prolyl cis-trans isomerase-like 6 [Anoplophora glabripennis]
MSSDSESKTKFLVVGMITSDEFQKCRFIVNKLSSSYPKKYEAPQIRAMLDVEWEEYVTKTQREYGGAFWEISKSVMVYLNHEYLGDDKALERHISKKYRFTLTKNWYEMGKCHLADYLEEKMSKFRQLAYLTVSIDNRVIGTMLFELYNDIVPLASENFLTKCKITLGGYAGSPIHRIMKNSWIQCGGYYLRGKKMPCENYAVPHDRRGVLSTCNDGRHVNNSTQFFITLAPAPWMDYKYVAFGQLIQGADILKQIEEVPTCYQSPKHSIDIVTCGELVFTESPEYISNTELGRFQHLSDTALLDTLIGPLKAPAPSLDSFTPVSRMTKTAWPWKVLGRMYFPHPPYASPEDDEDKEIVCV